jgi:hypothetical protein
MASAPVRRADFRPPPAINPNDPAAADAGLIDYRGVTAPRLQNTDGSSPMAASLQPTDSPRLPGEWRHVD